MNILIIIGLVLAAGTIAVDHLIYPLPQAAAIVLFTAAVILLIAGMIKRQYNSDYRE
jgi:predicted tellurium resistance membrane protein TerC